MSKRFEGSIKVEKRSVGKLIGGGGSNLKKVSQSTGHGTYIVAYNEDDAKKSGIKLGDFVRRQGRISNADSFYISANSPEAVISASLLLKNQKRPSEVVTVSAEAIGTIIGKKGSGINKIRNIAGDNCYIVHKHDEGGFVVTADTKSGVLRAVQKILDAEKSYFESQREFHRKRYKKVNEFCMDESNRYGGLEFSSDDDSDTEELLLNDTSEITMGFQMKDNITSRKDDNRESWEIRQQLFEREFEKLKETGRLEEAEKLSIQNISWREVKAYKKEMAESRSARRIKLSVNKKVPSMKEFVKLSDKTRVHEIMGSWSDGVSEEVRSNEGFGEIVKKKRAKYTGSWADAADTDSESESEFD